MVGSTGLPVKESKMASESVVEDAPGVDVEVVTPKVEINRFIGATEIIAAVIIFIMMLHVVANALSRYFLNHPLEGTNEIVSYWYLPLIVAVGFVAAEYRNEHIEARLVFDLFPTRVKYEVHFWGIVLVMLTSLLLVWFTGREAIHNMEIGLTGGVSGIVIWPATFGVPVAYLGLAFLLGVKAYKVFKNKAELNVEDTPVEDPSELLIISAKDGK